MLDGFPCRWTDAGAALSAGPSVRAAGTDRSPRRQPRDGGMAASAATGASVIVTGIEAAACNGMPDASAIGLPHMIQIEVNFK
ncbi:hypothetical protein [Burkholderia sp. BCC0398]|uniref:hypothetical protein n=1 Tax=Burkholderia sp. BCC0398 TaxID=2676297 RepID=UPI0011D02A38|nr:hypothetical protein [Burkholderia sp. BCC0398]